MPQLSENEGVLCLDGPHNPLPLDLPAVNGETASLGKFFDMERFVALVRPDHIVGLVMSPSDLLHGELEIRAALGRFAIPFLASCR
jgi:hypothetical protein